MAMILDETYSFVKAQEVDAFAPEVAENHRLLHQNQGPYAPYLGWLDPRRYLESEEYQQVLDLAKEIQAHASALIVIGIGGSYLSAKAIIRALTNTFQHGEAGVRIYFANSLSGVYLTELLDLVQEENLYVNVVSKSGTTLETAIIFRQIKDRMERKYGKTEAARRIIATTDAEKGTLYDIAEKEGYRRLTVPSDIGGRYSAFTSAAMLPVAVRGLDTRQLLLGAAEAAEAFSEEDLRHNAAYRYAVLRNILYHRGKTIEMLVNHEYKMQYVADWFKQLFGESEGKEEKGIFPVSVNYTADLHSFGQYVQEGRRQLFETTLHVRQLDRDMGLAFMDNNADGLDFLLGQSLNEINHKALQGAILAHAGAQVPNIIIEMERNDTYHLGGLLYFFMKACAMSGLLLGVHPFDQPGVEAYKKEMRRLLHERAEYPS